MKENYAISNLQVNFHFQAPQPNVLKKDPEVTPTAKEKILDAAIFSAAAIGLFTVVIQSDRISRSIDNAFSTSEPPAIIYSSPQVAKSEPKCPAKTYPWKGPQEKLYTMTGQELPSTNPVDTCAKN